MSIQQTPNQVKFQYLIERIERSEEDKRANREVYRIKISYKNKKFYLFNMTVGVNDKDGTRWFRIEELLGGILSYQHKDLLIKRLKVPGYDGYLNTFLTHEELNNCIDYLFKRTRNLLYDGQTYSKGRIAYDIIQALYAYINEHDSDTNNQDNKEEALMLENDLDIESEPEIMSNYNDEGDSIDAFVKIKNPKFYGEFILSIQKNPDGTIESLGLDRFYYLVSKLKDLVDNMVKVNEGD